MVNYEVEDNDDKDSEEQEEEEEEWGGKLPLPTMQKKMKQIRRRTYPRTPKPRG